MIWYLICTSFRANISFSIEMLCFLLLPPFCQGCLCKVFRWEILIWTRVSVLSIYLCFLIYLHNTQQHSSTQFTASTALHHIRFFKILRKWAWCLTLWCKECGDSTVAGSAAPFHLGASDHVFPQLILGSLSGSEWGKSPSTTHWLGTNCSHFFSRLKELRNPLSLPVGVSHTIHQAASIKPTRFLLQWTDSALREKWL